MPVNRCGSDIACIRFVQIGRCTCNERLSLEEISVEGPVVAYSLQTLRGDVFGGLTAAVVALPLALAFGVASGLGAIEGLYGAVAVGFLAAVFGGTKIVISGPTGPMAIAMAVIIANHAGNDIGHALTIVVLAGIIQILLGLVRIGRLVSYTPYSVISGFMSGIGVIIMVIQTLPFMGLPVKEGGPLETIRQWPQAVQELDWSALTVAAVTLGVVLAWPRRFREVLPSAVAALIVGTLLSVLWLSDIPVIGEVPTGLPELRMPDLSAAGLLADLQPALTIALLGAIDTLLTALIADSMTRERHDPNRELVGQGLGNTLAGLVGGVPGAGATMGTVVNIRAGARTRVAGALCAVLLLAVTLGLGRYVESIPHAVLAGILIKVGWDIVDWRFITHLHRVQREHLLVMVVTLGLTVFADLVTAVVLGLVAAGMASARQFERLELDSVMSVPLLDDAFLRDIPQGGEPDKFSARVGLVALRGTFTVASSNKLITTLGADVRDHEVVIIDFTDTVYMDDSAALVVEQLIDIAMDENTECIVVGTSELPIGSLQALDVLQRLPADRFVNNRDEARELAERLLAAGRQG
ncbi:MAG: SulP family inorganic anion transporter [Acidimicrobiaceae bacterium]|nr:SulP family inorganic anion transporter [Acidimicrobiaceae bacterium]MYH78415.1 SulP family inorganic anion transporter [Acidimicrobiaceae bacterium]MYK75328.1 SulP family inorganic anion transporter [Acidimicrobiaceae bacterium]